MFLHNEKIHKIIIAVLCLAALPLLYVAGSLLMKILG